MDYNFFIPANLNLDELIEKYPPDIPHFKKEKLLYILNTIIRIEALNHDIAQDTNGLVPINASLLRQNIGDRYHLYLQYLVESDVLITNNHFSKQQHISRKYGFTDAYDSQLKEYKMPISAWLARKVQIDDDTVEQIDIEDQPTFELADTNPLYVKLPANSSLLTNAEQREYNRHMRHVFPDVFKWYREGGLQIDHKFADYYNGATLRFKKYGYVGIDTRWNRKRKLVLQKNPTNQFRSNSYNILELTKGHYNVRFDANVFRLYSSLIAINKDYRPAITWKGQPLVSIDITNSQPYLLAALLNPDFWQEVEKSTITLYNLPYHNNYKHLYPLSNIITLCNFLVREPYDIRNYKLYVSGGRFYEEVGKLLSFNGGVEYSRNEVKELMFKVLFTSNEAITQGWAKAKREFARIFPNINRLIREIQSTGSSNLPCLLQRLESYIVFTRILPAINRTYPNLPVFTIHDSVVTLKGHEEAVREIMHRELHQATGIRPHFKFEYWSDDYVKYNLFHDEIMLQELIAAHT